VFELEQYVLNVLGDPSPGHFGTDDLPEADRQLQTVAERWAALADPERQNLLRRVVREVVYHARKGTISITLTADAVVQLSCNAPAG
jgi:hypothetical protein